ncbi:MAG: ERF family protein [Acidimicrobiales bacterium]
MAEALVKAQAEFPTIPKTHVGKIMGQGKNGPYEYSYNYADLADTVAATVPILTKHGLAVCQMPEWDGEDLLSTRVMHTSGEWIEAAMRLLSAKLDPQGQGSAITYARRYAYCAALGIVADEDDDGRAASTPPHRADARPSQPKAASAERKASDKQMAYVAKLIVDAGVDDRWVEDLLGVETLRGMSAADVSRAIDELHSLRTREG